MRTQRSENVKRSFLDHVAGLCPRQDWWVLTTELPLTFYSILKPLVLVPQLSDESLFLFIRPVLIPQSKEHFWTASTFLKVIPLESYAFLCCPRVILIFSPSPWMHLRFLNGSILVRQRFLHMTSKPTVSWDTVFEVTPYTTEKKLISSTHFQLWNVPK